VIAWKPGVGVKRKEELGIGAGVQVDFILRFAYN
jgi:hypothetical protein